VHGPVDHWPDYGSQSTLHHGQEQWTERGSPVFPWVGPHRDGAGSKRRGWGSTPVGMRWQRGSDGWAMADQDSGWSSSTRGCSR
jgi:hypothetical protein